MVEVNLLLLNAIKGLENQGKLFKETPAKPWVFTILHKILPTGKENLFLFFSPQTDFAGFQKEGISQRRNVLFPFGYSTAMHVLSTLT